MNNRQKRFFQKCIASALTLAMTMGAPLTDSAALLARAEQTDVGIVIRESSGYEEGAYAEWLPVEGADGYQVYVSKDAAGGTDPGSGDKEDPGSGDKGDPAGADDGGAAPSADSQWNRIDDELIRSYDDGSGGVYMRADALGLTPGTWYLKIEAATFNSYGEKLSTVAEKIVEAKVTAHDRSGFAWQDGTSSGAYNEDGSLKKDARVLYVTEETKDKVSMTVQGADGAKECVGLQNIFNGYKAGREDTPLAVRFIGRVTDPSVLSGGDLALENGNNGVGGITIEGVGEDAVLAGFGIRMQQASNVEIRNLAFMLCDSNEGDNVSLEKNNDHIWVHDNDFFYGMAGSDEDQKKGDGMLDCKLSNYVTFSYNHFWDSGKSCLLGLNGESDELYITYHHNWFDHSDSRHPRVRSYSAHVYNNYYDGISKYGVGATMASSVFVENNYFRGCKYSMLISMQGSDSGTFSNEDGGMIKACGNKIVDSANPLAAYDETKTPREFDAYVASDRTEKVPETVVTKQGNTPYNNFDTEQTNYISAGNYELDDAEDVPGIVKADAGRLNGGDFQYAFDDASADKSYTVDETLKKRLQEYQASLLSVGGIIGASEKLYCTVTFDPANGEDSVKIQTEINRPIAEELIPADPETIPEGKVQFDAWYNGDAKWDFRDAVKGDMTLTAHYLAEDEVFYHGGTAIGSEPVSHVIAGTVKGDNSTLSSKYFEIDGTLYDNSGTSASYNGEGSIKGYGLVLKTSTVKFTTTTQSSTLVLVLRAGSSQKVNVDGAAIAAVNGIVEKEIGAGSHTVTGKNTDYLFKIYVIPVKEAYTVTVDKQDGSDVVKLEVKFGEPLTKEQLPDPVREGYTFTGWVDGANNKVTLPFTPDGDMTLTATWEENKAKPDLPLPGDGLHVQLVDGDEYTYTGLPIQPSILVSNNGVLLTEGTDYAVKYKNNVNAADKGIGKKAPSVTVTGKGNLSGSNTATFTIKPRSLDEVTVGSVVVADNAKATPVLVYNGVKLGNKDFENPSASMKFTEDATITVTGKGNYEGEREIPVTVVPKSELKKFNVKVGKEKLIFDPVLKAEKEGAGEDDKAALHPTITVNDKTSKAELIEDQDYAIVYNGDGLDAGTVKFTVIGLGLYSGSVTKSYKINPLKADASQMDAAGIDEQGYTFQSSGVTLDDDLTVTYRAGSGDIPLTAGKDYKLSYSNNKKVGVDKAKVTVTFLGNYKGTKAIKKTFTIHPAPLSDGMDGLLVVSPDKVYTGKPGAYASKPYVTVDGAALKASDYTVKYYRDAEMTSEITGKSKLEITGGATEATVYVKVTGKGSYAPKSGDIYATTTYQVRTVTDRKTQDLSGAKVTFLDAKGAKVTKLEYTGEPVTPVSVKVELGGRTLTQDEDYTVTYVNNLNKGKATAIVTACEDSQYAGSKTAGYSIVAKNVKTLLDLFIE